MTNNEKEKMLKKMALMYVKEAGAKYKLENRDIMLNPTPDMDAKMTDARRRQSLKIRKTFVSIAASIIVLVSVGLWVMSEIGMQNNEMYNSLSATSQMLTPADAGAGALMPETDSFDSTGWQYRTTTWPNQSVDFDMSVAMGPTAPPPSLDEPESGAPQLFGARRSERVDAAYFTLTPPEGWSLLYHGVVDECGTSIFDLQNMSQELVRVAVTYPAYEDLYGHAPNMTPIQISEITAYLQLSSGFDILTFRHGGIQFELIGNYQHLIDFAYSITAED